MSSIAETVIKKPRKSKEEARQKKLLEEYNKAREKSVYHWVDVSLLLASGLRPNSEIRAFAARCHEKNVNKRTPKLIEDRDRLLRKYLPQLREAGLLPAYSTSYIYSVIVKGSPDDEELQAFWADYCETKVLTKARANFQTKYLRNHINKWLEATYG
eukprot:scaffold54288_cov61-Cyclotella_meneghiniana.AAC.1